MSLFPTLAAVFKYLIFCLPEIIQDPENKTVFLHLSAVFTCETRGGTPSWFINGVLLEELKPELDADISTKTKLSEGMTMAKLTILAKAQYNETTFQCGVFTFGGSARSENATLKVQGIFSL